MTVSGATRSPTAGQVVAGRRAAGPSAGRPGRPDVRMPGPEAEGGRPSSRPAASLALLLFTIASAASLLRVFAGHSWIFPVLISVLTAHLLCFLLRRLRAPSALAAPVVILAAALVLAWTVFGADTVYGLPAAKAWDQATAALRALSGEFSANVAPVPVTKGFEMLAVAGAALAAALADWLAFRLRLALWALVPGLSVFIYCCTAGTARHRGALIGVEMAGACLFLLIDRATAAGRQAWFAGVRPSLNAGVLVSGSILAAVAVLVAVALTPALGRRDGSGVLGWRNGPGLGGGVRLVPNPLVDLQTEVVSNSNAPAFVVSSNVPSYWRLTSLDDFNGTTWSSTGSYRSVGGRLPGVPPASDRARTVKATFQIQELDSPWLPAQFTPYAVAGARHVSYDPGSGSLLGAGNTPDGLIYSVDSYQALDTLSAADLESAPPVSDDPAVAGDLDLPPSLDPLVASLAVSVTRGQTTEYGKALAIQNYLRGPDFTYSLHPASDGSGDMALAVFLFQTRQGYCQQFAAAFAVLAREVGLPTRLAIGFATGQSVASGEYQVLGKDAHTWPEVYFGPQYGWVPFEPTKGFSIPGSANYAQVESGSDDGPGPAPPVATTTPTTGATSPSGSIHRTGSRLEPSTQTPVSTTTSHGSGAALWWLAIPAVVVAWLAANGLGPLAVRRWRRRRAVAAGPAAVVAGEWDDISRLLDRLGLSRRPSETDDEYASRATAGLVHMAVIPPDARWAHGGPAGLAGLSRRVTYGSSLPDDVGPAAMAAAEEIRQCVRASLSTRERIRQATMPPPGSLRRLGRWLRSEDRWKRWTGLRAPLGHRRRPHRGWRPTD